MQPDPTPYPKVDIGGTSYELFLRSSDVIRLFKAGIDLGEKTTLTGMAAVERTTLVLQAAIAHQVNIEITELQNMIPWGRIPEINLAIAEAVSLVVAQAIALKPAVDEFVAKQKAMNPDTTPTTVQ